MSVQIVKQSTSNLESTSARIQANEISDVMIISMKSKDIKNLNGSDSQDRKIQFHNKLFVKGLSFSKQFRNFALQFCRQCLLSQLSCLNCLFVERDSYFTI